MTHFGPGAAEGTVRVPGSKSVTHRAYLLAAQSTVPCTVIHPLRGADTDATLGCLHRLGYRIQPEERAVRFLPADPAPPREPLDCRNAGTALRLLAATVARFPWPTILTGDDSLRTRPNASLLDALRRLGARVEGTDTAPFTIHGPIGPGQVRFPDGLSSQYASGLLLSLPFLPGPSTVVLDPPVSSSPYLDVTLDLATAYGLRIQEVTGEGRAFRIPGGDRPRRDHFLVEGDWSSAAFPLVAAAITGGRVTVQGLRSESHQGDRAILDHLAAFGATVHAGEEGITVEGGGLESPGTISVAQTPDLFPALAVLAAASRGTTTFTGGAALRHKESDRINAMAQGLSAMGIEVQERPDGLVVHGGRLRGATVHAFDDHRIHMALAVAALAADGSTEVDGAESARVSYPGFHHDLAHLTGGDP